MKHFFFLSIFLTLPLLAENCELLESLTPDCCITPSGEEECGFLSVLSCESRRLYQSLDCEGKNRAIELALCYEDKDCAVEQAAWEMYQRQQGQYPNLEDYEQRVEDESGQNAYNRRFGY